MKISPIKNITINPLILANKNERRNGVISDVLTILSETNLLAFKKITIPTQNWHKEHNNLKFIVFSDLHANRIFLNNERIETIVDAINNRKPNYVLMLGDFLFGKSKKMPISLPPEEICEQLKRINAPKYAVLGNHDHIVAPDRMKKSLNDAGIRLLNNESETITENSKQFCIAGVDDVLYGKPNLKSALQKIPPKMPTILLSHNPNIFKNVPPTVSLTLAGHTHNFQITLPIFRQLIKLLSKCDKRLVNGEIREGGKVLYVTQGIGTSNLPLRINIPPEILDITIKKAN